MKNKVDNTMSSLTQTTSPKLSKKLINPCEHIDQNDSVLIAGLLSPFSDSDSDSATSSKVPKKTMSKMSTKTIDSGIITNEFDLINDDDLIFDFNDLEDEKKYNLNLENLIRVKVLKIEEKRSETILTVEDETTKSSATVICSGAWYRLNTSINEYVTIKAKRKINSIDWIIDNDHGICIIKPDILVNGTTVVNSLFCQREGVLSSKLGDYNALPNLEVSMTPLILGSLIHRLLQTALTENIFEISDLNKLFDNMVKEPSTMTMLYSSNLTNDKIKSLANEYIMMTHKFMYRYVKGKNLDNKKDDNFNGKIVDVKDIEESVYLPLLGLKGKIDATVEVKLYNNYKKIMPLEIKTGKTSFYPSHKGQIYLYCLMLNILGTKVDGGLLLYIKDNIMKEVKSARKDERELLLQRNSMAYYLSTIPDNLIDNDSDKLTSMKLPNPIFHEKHCNNCAYNTVCTAFADRDEDLYLSEHHPIAKFKNSLIPHLTDDHINYVIKWISLVEIEEAHNRNIELARCVWNTTPISREKKGICISNLKIIHIEKYHNRMIHHFVRSFESLEKNYTTFPVDNFTNIFNENDCVSINTNTRVHLASGTIISINKNEIKICIDKDITKWNSSSIFHIDLYPYYNKRSITVGTVATLLTDNDTTNKLRRIIIDKIPATFNTKLPNIYYSNEAKKIRSNLNRVQDDALKTLLTADDYLLIRGMPGTGKTHLIVAIIELLMLMGKTVLVTAHTHTAVNNILLKLLDKKINFLKLGASSRMHSLMINHCEDAFIKSCNSPEMLDAKISKAKIIGVTCLAAGHALLSKKIFDYCIIDECSQALQPILLKPLFNATKFVLVGDPEQLSPIVVSPLAKKCGMQEDIFSRLDTPNNTKVLSLQYRMNYPIMTLANELTYDGKLRTGNETVSNATYNLTDKSIINKSAKWVQLILSNELNESVIMLNTGPTHPAAMNKLLNENDDNVMINNDDDADDSDHACSNVCEASIVKILVDTLILSGVKIDDIGIISPYRAQICLLRQTIKYDVEINTVDQYQGRDKSIIIFTFSKSVVTYADKKPTNIYEILEDHRRINVALTRAKHKLIVIADVLTIERSTPVKKMIDYLDKEKKIMHLKNGTDEFSWTNVLADIEDLKK